MRFKTTRICDKCRAEQCYMTQQCQECHGSGLFIGAGIGGGYEPNYYGLEHPSKLPCRICGGEGFVTVYCPNF